LVQKFHFRRIPGITKKIIDIPAKILGFPQIRLPAIKKIGDGKKWEFLVQNHLF